jgi:hypothetical protein
MVRDDSDEGPAELIYANGVNGLTGEYLLAPFEAADVAGWARQPVDRPAQAAAQAAALRDLWRRISDLFFGLAVDILPEDVPTAGWAVVFSVNEDDDVKAALEPLIEHRKRQVGDARTKVLEHRPGEQWREWLDRHGTAPGNVVPERVPYYVLLVGSPQLIPFSFQYLLDVEYAVGRLDFDDADGYRRYVEALIEREAGDARPRDATVSLFGTRHPFDRATQLSADSLVTPLAESFQPGGRFAGAIRSCRVDRVVGAPATKAALGEIFAGAGASGRPALLFSATHGLGGWPPGHAEQEARHGALLCQDWPGLGQIGEEQYFAAADLRSDACVDGLVAFFFACYGAGTPRLDAFRRNPGEQPPTIADEPFVARLPKALLSHTGGGALAVIGHIERAWGWSFLAGGGEQLLPFQNAIVRILRGEPVGHAMKDFNERYALLSTNLSGVLESIEFAGEVVPDADLARLWMERNDAQNYVVLGDPAATLKTL